jgi:hypothetical protein
VCRGFGGERIAIGNDSLDKHVVSNHGRNAQLIYLRVIVHAGHTSAHADTH